LLKNGGRRKTVQTFDFRCVVSFRFDNNSRCGVRRSDAKRAGERILLRGQRRQLRHRRLDCKPKIEIETRMLNHTTHDKICVKTQLPAPAACKASIQRSQSRRDAYKASVCVATDNDREERKKKKKNKQTIGPRGRARSTQRQHRRPASLLKLRYTLRILFESKDNTEHIRTIDNR
jgi:hypothetical protein